MSDSHSSIVDGDEPVVLCIDDDPGVSETIELRLRQYNVELLRAYHGMHGLWLARTQHPDLIITDVRMPQGCGDYVIECLRSNPDTRDIPIVVLSGQQTADLYSLINKFRIDAVLTKPVRFNDLASTIRNFIPLRQRRLSSAGSQF